MYNSSEWKFKSFKKENSKIIITSKDTVAQSRIFLLVDLQEFFFLIKGRGTKKKQ